MLLEDILEKKYLSISEEMFLIEAEEDLKKALISALVSETKSLSYTPSFDSLANRIFLNYVNEIRNKKSDIVIDRYKKDKAVFDKISTKDIPYSESKKAERYVAILNKNKSSIISSLEKEINKKANPKLSVANDWMVELFSDKPVIHSPDKKSHPNNKFDVQKKNDELTTKISDKIKTKKVENEKFTGQKKNRETKEGFMIEAFEAFLDASRSGSLDLKARKNWIRENITVAIDQPTPNTPRPKSDLIVGSRDNGYEIELKKVKQLFQDAKSEEELGKAAIILYADVMRFTNLLEKVEEIEQFKSFFIMFKEVFQEEVIKLATKTIQSKTNYLVLGVSDKNSNIEAAAARGCDFVLKNRGPVNDKPNKPARWEIGISRRAYNVKKLSDVYFKNIGLTKEQLKKDIENKKEKFKEGAQPRVNSGFSVEGIIKQEENKAPLFNELKSLNFSSGETFEKPNSKLSFKFSFRNKPCVDGDMEFYFNNKKNVVDPITPNGKGSKKSPKASNVIDAKNEFRKVDTQDFKHATKMDNISASVDTVKEEKINKFVKELLILKEREDV